MDIAKIRGLADEIRALPEEERQKLAEEVLAALLTTRAGLHEIDRALESLADEDLDALLERARARASDLSEATVSTVIAEALRAARAQGRC